MTTPDDLSPGRVFAFSSLWTAARRAARGKRGRAGVASFRLDLESQLIHLGAELLGGHWQPRPTVRLLLHDPKPRVISVPAFRDRVVHHALAAALAPRVERRFITDTYACRVGHGTLAAHRRARAWARTYGWWVRLDVAQFFPSIDHGVVRDQLRQDVPHRALRAVCEVILAAGGTVGHGRHFPGDDLFAPVQRATGLPLGNLTSQLWANRFLDPVDHLVKDRLRLRGYVRYMDDMLLFHHDPRALTSMARAVEDACLGLRLRLHPWSVQPTAQGVGFLGYRTFPRSVRVRRTSVGRAERRLRYLLKRAGSPATERFQDSVQAVFAHWAHADTWRLREHTLRRLGLLYEPGGPVDDDDDSRGEPG